MFRYVNLLSLLGKMKSSWEILQGATLSFTGNGIKEAITGFAKFVSREHDHKGAQFGQFIYTNSSVSSTFRSDCVPNLPLAW
jgi:hypothetical protein